MLSLTRKTDYALVALAYLGQQHRSGEVVSARRIADQFGLPLPLLMNILKELGRARMVVSSRGAQGGYSLAVEPEKLSLLAIVNALEGPVRLSPCADSEPGGAHPGTCCTMEDVCNIRGPVRRLHHRLQQFLESVTLADLMESGMSGVDVPLERVGVEAAAGAGSAGAKL